MNNIKNIFSIKDLENLSGIKAHTIRIWEKRYSVLQPMRSETNIRLYDLESLQKLLNIKLLHKHGYKISNISKLPDDRIPALVREIISEKSVKNHAISSFKVSMLNFDRKHFLNTYDTLLTDKSFRDIFYDVFIPLLHELGLLWQAGTITPAQEHFISNLIKQKLIVNIEKIPLTESETNQHTYVLFLPENEIHELGLMYINYELLLRGCKTIYLGESLPISNLIDMARHFKSIIFITYMTVEPGISVLSDYIQNIHDKVLKEDSELWICGRVTEHLDGKQTETKTKIFHSIPELVSAI